MRRILAICVTLGFAMPSAWAGNTGGSTTTLTIDPSATAGTTITAADENDRSNDASTWANAHVHSLSNTTSVGDNLAGDKNLCFDAADTTDMCLRFDDTANLVLVNHPATGSYNQVASMSSTTGLTSRQVVLGDGTGPIRTTSGGSSGQVLTHQGASDPSWTSLLLSGRVARTDGDVTTTSATLVDFTGASVTITTGANPVLAGFSGGCFVDDATGAIWLNVDIDGALLVASTNSLIGSFGQHATASEVMNCSFAALSAPLTAASHTFKLQWSRQTAGTATMKCDGSYPCIFWVVEVGD